MTKIKKGLYRACDLTNAQYHGDTDFYSSSQIKTANEDIELFFKKYIAGEAVPQKSISAFDIGTYYHTAILEPELLEEESAIFTGRRSGKIWDAFKEEHEGKLILTPKELLQAEILIEATKESPIAMELLGVGGAELSCFTSLLGLKVKVRADWINLEDGYILDLKSTTGSAKDEHKIKGKVSSFNYDLSASMYIDAFNAHYGEEVIKDFYWTFASKDVCNCKTYKASQDMLELGRVKYKKAFNLIKKYKNQDWQFYDELAELAPNNWEKDIWMEEVTEGDLL